MTTKSEHTCGPNYAAEQDIHIETTRNVTWTPLLRKITLGLRGIDTDKSTNVRVKAEANNQKPDGASIDVTSWGDTKFLLGRRELHCLGKLQVDFGIGHARFICRRRYKQDGSV